MTEHNGGLVLFRLDATRKIGSGHAMRCLSIAETLEKGGISSAFIVSCAESQHFLEGRGATVYVVDGDALALGASDAQALIGVSEQLRATAVLVDTYGARDEFYTRLAEVAPHSFTVAVMDDMYSIEHGSESIPRKRSCDIVINYDFLAEERGYYDVYGHNRIDGESAPLLLLGPSYAPVRKVFRCVRGQSVDTARRILITSGSTNPNQTLEKMVEACSSMSSDMSLEIDVIVGTLADYSSQNIESGNVTVRVHEGVQNLSPFMHEADIMISAGGSTLYEAACAGIPTIAIPVVGNQIQNVAGYIKLGLGVGVNGGMEWSIEGLRDVVTWLVKNRGFRTELSRSGQRVVDGNGAERIIAVLCGDLGKYPHAEYR